MKKLLLLSLLFTATCKPVLDLNLENRSLSDAVKPALVNRFIGTNKVTDKQVNIPNKWQKLNSQENSNMSISDCISTNLLEPNTEVSHEHLSGIILAKIQAFKSKDSNERNNIRKLIFDLLYICQDDRPAIVNEALLNSKIFRDIEDFSKYMDYIALIYQNKLNSVQNNVLRIFLQKKVDLARQLTNQENIKKYLVEANFDWLQEKNLLKNEIDLNELANNIDKLQFDITDTNKQIIDTYAAIHGCIKNNDIEKLRALILLGANINLQTSKMKVTPLYIAVIKQNIYSVKELLRFGAKTDLRDHIQGWYPLNRACKHNNKILEILLELAINKSDTSFRKMLKSVPKEDWYLLIGSTLGATIGAIATTLTCIYRPNQIKFSSGLGFGFGITFFTSASFGIINFYLQKYRDQKRFIKRLKDSLRNKNKNLDLHAIGWGCATGRLNP